MGSMRKAVLDRFEEQMAVFILEDTGEIISFPRHELSSEIAEGDYVFLSIEANVIQEISYDEESTLEAKKRILEKLERLRRGDHLKKDNED
jgi:hypothetical protein